MNRKKLGMIIATALITALASVPVYAKDGDVYDTSTTQLINHGSISSMIFSDRTNLLKMINNMGNYGYEVSGKIYKVSDVNTMFNKSPKETIAQLQADIKANLTAISNAPSATTSTTTTSAIIAKIEITSTTLGVQAPTMSGDVAVAGNGYATYRILDQNGNDITNSVSAQDIIWTCKAGTITASNGLLTITPLKGNVLTDYTTVTINGVCQKTGATASANLNVTQNGEALSSIKLNYLYCASNPSAALAGLAAGDTKDSFYIDYTALDVNGNTTKNYKFIKNSLMTDGSGNVIGLISSNPDACTVSLVTDPNNSNNALIKVTPTSDSNSALAGQPVVITVFTTDGKSASITLTLNKAGAVDGNTLTNITLNNLYCANNSNAIFAAGDTTDSFYIDYSATDLNRNDTKNYNLINAGLLNGSVISSNPDAATVSLVKDPNNSNNALIKVTPTSDSNSTFAGQPIVITAFTTAGQHSSITLNLKKAGAVDDNTLSNITLNKLYCTNNPNAIFAAGDTTDSFYIDYTAIDLSGNDTKNYNLISAGLMKNTGTITGLISSNPNAATVSLVRDPNNSNNALIQVTPTSDSNSIVADQPVVITMFTSNGKSASITLNLKKAAVLDKFTLMAPSTTVYAGDKNVIIPFKAVDQDGNVLTKYSDINGEVAISGSFPTGAVQLVENTDGTASLVLNVPATAVQSPLTSQEYTLQAVSVSSGKFSSINIEVMKK